MPRRPRTAEEKEKRNLRDRQQRRENREAKEKLKQLEEKEERRKEKQRGYQRKYDRKQAAERRRTTMSSPQTEPPSPAPGVQSPPSTPFQNCLSRATLSSLDPTQLLSNESMQRCSDTDRAICALAAKSTDNAIKTMQTCHENQLKFFLSRLEAFNEQGDAHVTRMLDDELT